MGLFHEKLSVPIELNRNTSIIIFSCIFSADFVHLDVDRELVGGRRPLMELCYYMYQIKSHIVSIFATLPVFPCGKIEIHARKFPSVFPQLVSFLRSVTRQADGSDLRGPKSEPVQTHE